MSTSEVARTMQSIMAGRLSDADIETFLLTLRNEGETVEDIVAAARVMREHAVRLPVTIENLVDTCGTGGDAKNTLNVSTLSSLVVASAGVWVAKHGNRSVSSSCGSADLLEMLGVKINLNAAGVARLIDKTGFGFFFAPNFHPATKNAMAARKNIKGKTIFNLLGPLTNPAGAKFQLMGVYDQKWVEPMAEVLKELGSVRAMVVHGLDGMDEITVCDKTIAAELKDGRIRVTELEPAKFGIRPAQLSSLQVSSKERAKEMAMSILNGNTGPASDIVCLNAGAALYVRGAAKSIEEGLSLARSHVQYGTALQKLEQIARESQLL